MCSFLSFSSIITCETSPSTFLASSNLLKPQLQRIREEQTLQKLISIYQKTRSNPTTAKLKPNKSALHSPQGKVGREQVSSTNDMFIRSPQCRSVRSWRVSWTSIPKEYPESRLVGPGVTHDPLRGASQLGKRRTKREEGEEEEKEGVPTKRSAVFRAR